MVNCFYCSAPMGGPPSQRKKTRDHKIPLSRGGMDIESNIVDACDLCNRTKANMTDAEYFEWINRGRPKKTDYLREIGL